MSGKDHMPGRAVFLDRDGVINRAMLRAGRPHPPASLAELVILPGVPQALAHLRAAGYRLVVVSNQPDVARGVTSQAQVEAMHAVLRARLPLDAILTCVHDDADRCGCRKPAPGLILQAARQLGLDCAGSYLVGDRWRDIEAGRRAGCCTFFIDHGYDEPAPRSPDYRVRSLLEASRIILDRHPEPVSARQETRVGSPPVPMDMQGGRRPTP
jgi:D-glycero-D-manno-heptose 1,7-bisphosphate phosphatase